MTGLAEQHLLGLVKDNLVRLEGESSIFVYHRRHKRWIKKKPVINPTTGRQRLKFGLKRTGVALARVIWIVHTKQSIPDYFVVDHINGDKKDDRLSNLQLHHIDESNVQGGNKIRNIRLERLCRWFEFIAVHGREPEETGVEKCWIENGF